MKAILRCIKEIYEEILSRNRSDAYFAKEAQLNEYFEQLYALENVAIQDEESSFLVSEVNRLNQLVTNTMQHAKNRLQQSQRAQDYVSRFADEAVFIDRKG